MADFAIDYKNFLTEFETLTDKKMSTLKNKGKEEGIKKIKVLFKAGKTLDARCADYDAAKLGSEKMGALIDKNQASAAKDLLKKLEIAYDKLNEGIKLNSKEFEAQFTKLGDPDKDLKTGLDVFLKRLEQLRKRGKMEVEGKTQELAKLSGSSAATGDEKLRSGIKIVYLTIGKGAAEAEALMKVFIAKPSEDTMMAAFSAGSGPRTLSTAVTNWKQFVLKQDPTMARRLSIDPATLLTHIADLTQRKDVNFWRNKLQMDKDKWEDRGKVVAAQFLQQLVSWRRLAGEIKALND